MDTSIENVLLIVIDALRTDRVGVYCDGELTPNLDTLAAEGEMFEQCYSCINATDPSLTTILTGQYPIRHGVINHGGRITQKERKRVSGTRNLAERLNDSHETIAVDVLGRWHQRGFGDYLSGQPNEQTERPRRAQIRDLFTAVLPRLPDRLEQGVKSTYSRFTSKAEPPEVKAENVTDTVINRVEQADGSWFAFAHYWDTHLPYTSDSTYPDVVAERSYEDGDVLIADLLGRIQGSRWAQRLQQGLLGDAETVGDVKRQYDTAVWRTDREVGRLVENLKANGEYEETAIVVTADHGESLTEHGIFFDHHGLYNPSIHVPLIIKAPQFRGRDSEFAQHFDLAPTILELLGEEYDEGWFDGVSLVPDTETSRRVDRDAIYVEEAHTAKRRAIRTDSYKYIKRLDESETCRYCDITHAPAEELYDVKNDPDERENIVDACPETAAQLAEALELWVNELPDPSEGEVDFKESPEVMQRLENMGYI